MIRNTISIGRMGRNYTLRHLEQLFIAQRYQICNEIDLRNNGLISSTLNRLSISNRSDVIKCYQMLKYMVLKILIQLTKILLFTYKYLRDISYWNIKQNLHTLNCYIVIASNQGIGDYGSRKTMIAISKKYLGCELRIDSCLYGLNLNWTPLER